MQKILLIYFRLQCKIKKDTPILMFYKMYTIMKAFKIQLKKEMPS